MANRVIRGLTWTVNWMYFDREDKGDQQKRTPEEVREYYLTKLTLSFVLKLSIASSPVVLSDSSIHVATTRR